jgi:hypothetical protein
MTDEVHHLAQRPALRAVQPLPEDAQRFVDMLRKYIDVIVTVPDVVVGVHVTMLHDDGRWSNESKHRPNTTAGLALIGAITMGLEEQKAGARQIDFTDPNPAEPTDVV